LLTIAAISADEGGEAPFDGSACLHNGMSDLKQILSLVLH